jgi:ParB/RepB/Spo0J family partition protein
VRRRRAEAATVAGLEAVDCIVREDDADDEELALVENVNRLEMHPLDEADIFRRMKEGGATVSYLAMHFARSRGMIAQRLRLSGLTSAAREMFREGRLEITGAVLLSGLPEEDQGAFCEKYAGKEATHWQVQEYIVRTQKQPLYVVMDGTCANCKERTRNGDAGLFEEDYRFEDVCLNPECYKERWHELIELALEEAAGEHRGSGEVTKIAFDSSIPAYVHENVRGEMDFCGKKYEVLKPQGYILSAEETNRKKNTYWRVLCCRENIEVKRCGYETREAHKKSEAKRMEQNLVTEYGEELLKAVGRELGERPENIARN